MNRSLFLPLLLLIISNLVAGTAVAVAAGNDWQAGGSKEKGMAGAWGLADDGRTRLDVGCNRNLGQTVSGSLNGYTGNALKKVDDQEEPVVFEVMDARGKAVPFNGKLNYFGPDGGWAYSNLPSGFLDVFAGGQKLILRNDKGVAVAEFSLKGAGPARAFLKGACGF